MDYCQIIEAYKNGDSISSICSQYGVKVHQLYYILRKHKIGVRGRKLSNEIQMDIVSRYQAGESSTVLRDRYKIDMATVYNLLKEHGVPTKTHPRQRDTLLAEEKEGICQAYTGDELPASIAARYNISVSTLYRVLRAKGIELNVGHRKVNHSFFSQVDKLRAYWIGFIAADGYVCDGKTLKVDLAERDREHLERLRDLLTDSPLYYRACKKTVALCISSSQIVSDLFIYGIHQSKSATLQLPSNLPDEFFPDWVRGYYDGNGWPASNGTIGISSNLVLLSQLKEELSSRYNISSSIQKDPKNQAFAKMNIGKRGSVAFLKEIYYPNCTCLYRKLIKARAVFPEAGI